MNVWKKKIKKMILDSNLNSQHLIINNFPLSEEVLEYLDNRNWNDLDRFFLGSEKPGGELFVFLSQYLNFQKIEHIIAIRSSLGEYADEDGIWHDDGSRILGFSLSLTRNSDSLSGGHLRFRSKSDSDFKTIPTQKLGKIILFKTGIYGFEHMVTAVTEGERIVIAGWCS